MSSMHVPVGAFSRFVLALLLLTVVPCAATLGQVAPLRVVVLGSSTAEGANASPLSQSWVNLYTAQLASSVPGSQVINLAVGGFTTFNVMPTGNIPPSPWNTSANQPAAGQNITAALTYDPTLIIVNLPTNDADLHVPVEQQMANYRSIVAAAAARRIPVWITTPQPRTTLDATGHQLLTDMITATYEAFQERTVDFWTGLGDANGAILATYNADGTHLNNAGHAVLFARAAATISTASPELPTIAMHPRARSVMENDSTSFSVIAFDTTGLTFRWQRNGADISGATSAHFAILHASLADSGAVYRCIVSNGTLHDTSAAAALTVRSLPSGGGSVVSDDFSGGTLNGSLWSIVNPLGDATFTITGTGTQNARLAIAVPAGVTHDLWVGAVTAPRVLQTVPNTDLAVEAKFDGSMNAEYQTQGIIAVQDASTFVRFDFVRDATRTRFFAASFSGGTPTVRKDTAIAGGTPLYLRVTRSGNSWTGAFSSDGTTWRTAVTFSATLTLTGIGPFAGNAGGSPPAFTSLVDYFFNTALPITPEDGPVNLVPPAITAQPQSQSIVSGQPVTFTVSASGSDPLSYQWQRNSAVIPGATNPSYTIAAVSAGDSGVSFRCVVTNGVGSVTSAAAVLTVTQPIISPGPVSDDFGGASINSSLWTAVNPLGDATFTLTGAGTQDARLVIGVPGGSSHDLWTGGFNAPRILQAVPNADFSLDVRFESNMTSQYQMQGIIVQQDAANLIRFDIVRDASSTRFFAATFSGGSAIVRKDTAISTTGAIILRVRRQGAAWTGSYSFDGTSWVTAAAFSHALTVTAAGPFAGNHGIPVTATPAFTALIDYVFNTASPIVPEDGPVAPVVPTVLTDPAGVTVVAGQPATFTITASGSVPLGYAWQRNGVTIPSAASASYTVVATSAADSGALFRCIVSNVAGADTSAPALLRVTTPPAGVTSDNFSAGTLNASLWTFENPLGDASVSMTGSQVRIAIPAGTAHDLWTGANDAPRLLQTVPNADLSVEAKFDAVMTSEYQTVGIIAVQDASTFIRFDVVRDAANTRFFSASFSGGSPTVRKDTIIATGAPLYLRVQRSGNIWTGSFSTNGTTWRAAVAFAAPLTLAAIGPFAGTAGSAPPAFNALIDYFFNTAAPLAARTGGTAITAPTATTEIPLAFALFQNYPNPFNPSSDIRYQISEFGMVRLAVYDLLGREMAVLVNEQQAPGSYLARFDAQGLPSGVYFYRLQSGAQTATRKMTLVR